MNLKKCNILKNTKKKKIPKQLRLIGNKWVFKKKTWNLSSHTSSILVRSHQGVDHKDNFCTSSQKNNVQDYIGNNSTSTKMTSLKQKLFLIWWHGTINIHKNNKSKTKSKSKNKNAKKIKPWNWFIQFMD